mgnify:FL=1
MTFYILKASNGQYYFTIDADNHQVLCTSETYVQKESAKHAINLIKAGAADAAVLDCTAY